MTANPIPTELVVAPLLNRQLPRLLRIELPKPGHECPTCYVGHSIRVIRAALEQLDAATETWIDSDEERSMAFYWLADEVRAVCAVPWWKPSRRRRRLREALRTAGLKP